MFCKICDNHAPLKTFQTIKKYAPWLREATKVMRKEREDLKQQSTFSEDPEINKKYRLARNQIKRRNENKKKTFYQNKFQKAKTHNDSSQMWNSAYEILGSKRT